MRRRPLLLALVAVAALTTACGSEPSAAPPASAAPSTSTTPDVGAPSTTPTGDEPAAAAVDLPAIDVVQLATGDAVALPSLATAGRPVLLWFWAPHCTFCRREAPDLLAFAAEHEGAIDVLGLGAQDSLDEAYGFLDDTSTHDLTMVWDQSGQSWIHHDVTSQPTVVVLDADGQVAGRWYREFDEAAILAAAGLT